MNFCTNTPIQKYFRRYGQSKIALISLARELARVYPDFTVAAVHPGRIDTGLGAALQKESRLIRWSAPLAPLICTSVEFGVRNHLWAATSPDVVSGQYYVPVGVVDKDTIIGREGGEALSTKLWEWTETELKGVEL